MCAAAHDCFGLAPAQQRTIAMATAGYPFESGCGAPRRCTRRARPRGPRTLVGATPRRLRGFRTGLLGGFSLRELTRSLTQMDSPLATKRSPESGRSHCGRRWRSPCESPRTRCGRTLRFLLLRSDPSRRRLCIATNSSVRSGGLSFEQRLPEGASDCSVSSGGAADTSGTTAHRRERGGEVAETRRPDWAGL